MENIDIIIPKNKKVFVVENNKIRCGNLVNIEFIKSCDTSENKLSYVVEMYDSGLNRSYELSQIFESEEVSKKYSNKDIDLYSCLIDERFSEYKKINFNIGILNCEVKSFINNAYDCFYGEIVKLIIRLDLKFDCFQYNCCVKSFLTDKIKTIPFYKIKF